MKIAFNGKEYANYLEPNAVDVLLDVTDRTNGIASDTTYNLNGDISNYEKLVIYAWGQNSGSLSTTESVESCEVSVSDVLASRSTVKPIIVI